MELIRAGASSTSSELAMKGLSLCKAIVPSQEAVEQVLFSDRANVTAVQVCAALMNAGGPYKALIMYYNELVAMHRHVCSSTAHSSSASRSLAL